MIGKFIIGLLILFVSIGCYIISWGLPALTFKTTFNSPQTWSGMQCAGMGIMSWIELHLEPFANFFYLAAVIFLLIPLQNKYLLSSIFSGIALVLGLETLILFVEPAIIPDSPGYCTLTKLEVGYYLWMLSFLLIFFLSLFNYQQGKKLRLFKVCYVKTLKTLGLRKSR